MKDFCKEFCKHCALQGSVSEPIKTYGVEVRYIDCQHDNIDTKEHFLHTLNKEDALIWARQEVELLHCIYLDEEFVKQMSFIHSEIPVEK